MRVVKVILLIEDVIENMLLIKGITTSLSCSTTLALICSILKFLLQY